MTTEINYLGDPVSSKLFDMVLQLAADFHVVSHRLRIIQLALQEKGVLTDAELQTFVPNDEQSLELDAGREARLGRILRIITEDAVAEFPLRDQWESIIKKKSE
jgi:hypothetical protein